MTYQPFLPEAAAGSLEPRHVVVSLRRELRGCEVINGRVSAINHQARTVSVTSEAGRPLMLRYDHVVLALGSVARTLPVPGLKEMGIGFKQVEEAIALRNHILERLDVAASVVHPALRARALTFVFVGGGYAGIEALGELQDMARDAIAFHAGLTENDLRFVLVEARGRILPEVREEMGVYTVEQLRSRGIDVRLETRLESCVDGEVVLSDGTRMSADTLVWTAGVKANPVLLSTDLPLDDRGCLRCAPTLQAVGDEGSIPGVWGAGDCAAVPDLTGAAGAVCSPSAQHAVRQHRGDPTRRRAKGLPTPPCGLGGVSRAPQRGSRRLRSEGQRAACVVHAPHLPHEPNANLQSKGTYCARLDTCLVSPPRTRCLGPTPRSIC
jgi:NADH dehydrogenase